MWKLSLPGNLPCQVFHTCRPVADPYCVRGKVACAILCLQDWDLFTLHVCYLVSYLPRNMNFRWSLAHQYARGGNKSFHESYHSLLGLVTSDGILAIRSDEDLLLSSLLLDLVSPLQSSKLYTIEPCKARLRSPAPWYEMLGFSTLRPTRKCWYSIGRRSTKSPSSVLPSFYPYLAAPY